MTDGVEIFRLQQAAGNNLPPLPPEDLPAFRAEVEAYARSLAERGLSLQASPFIVPDDADPFELADALSNLFYKIADDEGPKLSLIWREATRFAANDPALLPICTAGERIAADYDRGRAPNNQNAFHNRQHSAETLLCAHVLGTLDARSDLAQEQPMRLLLLLAALIYHWQHDAAELTPGSNYFRLEKRAMRAALPYISDLSEDHQLTLDLIVRASDLSGPHTFARQALAWHRVVARLEPTDPHPPHPHATPGIETISALFNFEHFGTAEVAAMLRDADIMPLAGLTADCAAVETSRLRDEWARPLAQAEYMAYLNNALSRPRTPRDRQPLNGETEGRIITFASRAGQLFNATLPEVVNGHALLMQQMGEEPEPEEAAAAASEEPEASIDLSVFEEVKNESDALADTADSGINLATVAALRESLRSAGFFDMPPFTLTLKNMEKLIGAQPSELMQRISLAEHSADTLQRLHGVPGPLMSAVVTEVFDNIGLRVDDAVYRAATAIARQIDEGHGIGTLDDTPGNERNPYHNHFHILDLVLICDLLGQRATQRRSPASSPLARGLLVLSALICHWHHTGRGNKVDGAYKYFHLQDRALDHASPFLTDISKELRQSLTIMVHSTDPREPYAFSRAAYAYHVGLGPRPDVPAQCDGLARLLGDPALCTLVARLNDAVFVPFVGLGTAYSSRSIVQLGREIGAPIDFAFVRKNLVAPMLSRPPYQGEQPPAALVVGKNRVASFTSAEAQAMFNPALHALLLYESKKS